MTHDLVTHKIERISHHRLFRLRSGRTVVDGERRRSRGRRRSRRWCRRRRRRGTSGTRPATYSSVSQHNCLRLPTSLDFETVVEMTGAEASILGSADSEKRRFFFSRFRTVFWDPFVLFYNFGFSSFVLGR